MRSLYLSKNIDRVINIKSIKYTEQHDKLDYTTLLFFLILTLKNDEDLYINKFR